MLLQLTLLKTPTVISLLLIITLSWLLIIDFPGASTKLPDGTTTL